MNKKNIFNYFKEYLATVIVTIVVVVLLCLCIELNLLFTVESQVNNNELNKPNLLEFCKIEQLEKRFKKEPENYIVAIRIAKHYEKLKENSKANDFYSRAVKLSGNSPYSIYSYSMFLAKNGFYGLSVELAERLTVFNKKNLEYKTQIYGELAKSLNKNGDYEAEVKALQIAQKYAKNLKDKDVLDKINENYAKAYINLADIHMNKNEIGSAILDLENSLKILPTPLAKYKLGLIYQNTDKIKAEKYFSDVLTEDIFILNPYIYNKLLRDLIEESKNSINYHSADFYTLKLSKLNRLMAENFVFRNEILISNFHIGEIKKVMSKNKQYSLYFDVNNNTQTKLKRLYMQIEIYVNNKQYVVKKEVINPLNSLYYYESLKQVKFDLPKEFEVADIKKQNDVTVKYYAKKRLKAPWTLLKIEHMHF